MKLQRRDILGKNPPKAFTAKYPGKYFSIDLKRSDFTSASALSSSHKERKGDMDRICWKGKLQTGHMCQCRSEKDGGIFQESGVAARLCEEASKKAS